MIVSVPNSILATPAKPVKKINKQVLEVIAKLKKTLVTSQNPKGVGLAAPQIGIPLRIFITKPTSSSPIEVFINPEITWRSKELGEINRPDEKDPCANKEKPACATSDVACADRKLEGCLSIPNVWGHLKRSTKLKLRYMDINEIIQKKEFSGFLATIVQHEVDHLDGILFTQRVLEQKEKLYGIQKDEKGKDRFVEIEV